MFNNIRSVFAEFLLFRLHVPCFFSMFLTFVQRFLSFLLSFLHSCQVCIPFFEVISFYPFWIFIRNDKLLFLLCFIRYCLNSQINEGFTHNIFDPPQCNKHVDAFLRLPYDWSKMVFTKLILTLTMCTQFLSSICHIPFSFHRTSNTHTHTRDIKLFVCVQMMKTKTKLLSNNFHFGIK